eukprot:s1713_g4.t1
MVMHDEGTTVVGAAVMDDMEDIDLQSLDDETQRPGPAEPIPEQLYPGDAFGITGWENIGFMDFLGFELASLSSQHSGFNSLPNVAGRARGGGMGTGSAFVTTLKSFIGMGILSLAFERWARCQGCQGVVFESSFTGTKRHDLTQTQTSSTNNTRRSRADLWILIALGLRSARICAMPAISSFFSRKGKKGKKVEEPQYEALPPPPADPVAPVAPAPGAPGAPGASLEPPAKAGAGAPSGGAPSDRTEPMTEVLPNPSVPDSEKSGKDVDPELGENKVERSLSPKKAEDKARSIVGDDLERAKDRGKLMLMVPVLLLVVGLVLTLVLLFLGAMPAPVQTGFDSLMGRSNACQSGEKGRCVSAAPIMHYYMYRVQNDEDYSPENQNMANIPGALWYLHNEIVWHPWLRAGTYAATPKTRIERFLVFSRASQELFNKGMNFGVVNTYDLGKCSGPYKCENLEEYGPVVGCESWNPKDENNFPHGQWTGTNVYPNVPEQ